MKSNRAMEVPPSLPKDPAPVDSQIETFVAKFFLSLVARA